MKVAIGCDHGGYNLKMSVIEYLEKVDVEIIDFGTDNDKDSVDYPEFAKEVCKRVVDKDVDFGILVCGTGIGMSIAANKIDGIRCAVLSDTFSARMTKMHNDANVISLGERVLGKGLAIDIVKAYMSAEFEGGRHQTRIDKVMELEHK